MHSAALGALSAYESGKDIRWPSLIHRFETRIFAMSKVLTACVNRRGLVDLGCHQRN